MRYLIKLLKDKEGFTVIDYGMVSSAMTLLMIIVIESRLATLFPG
jgi:Flp pilus assembly pilin Flp